MSNRRLKIQNLTFLFLLFFASSAFAESRIELRPYTTNDSSFVKSVLLNEQVNLQANVKTPDSSFINLLLGLARQEPQFNKIFIVTRTEDGAAMGFFMLNAHRNPGLWEYTLLLKPEYWGESYGKEVMAQGIPLLFDKLKATSLVGHISTNNQRSVGLAVAMGFELVHDQVSRGGLARDPSIAWGRFELTRSRFLELRAAARCNFKPLADKKSDD